MRTYIWWAPQQMRQQSKPGTGQLLEELENKKIPGNHQHIIYSLHRGCSKVHQSRVWAAVVQRQMSDCPASCLSPAALRHSASVKGYPWSVKQQANGKKTSLIHQFISIMLGNVSLQPSEKENRRGYTGAREQGQDGVHSTSAHKPSRRVNRICPESPINVDLLLMEPNNILFHVDKRG